MSSAVEEYGFFGGFGSGLRGGRSGSVGGGGHIEFGAGSIDSGGG